jgi:hypothetical protein
MYFTLPRFCSLFCYSSLLLLLWDYYYSHHYGDVGSLGAGLIVVEGDEMAVTEYVTRLRGLKWQVQFVCRSGL